MTDPVSWEGDTLANSFACASTQEPSPGAWRQELANAVRDPAILWRELQLDPSLLPAAQLAIQQFPLLLPRDYLARMRVGDPNDPLLRQVLPVGEELQLVPGFSADPLAETACGPVAGMLHKYHGRVLLVTTGACAVHCRYCFRRHFAYDELPRGKAWWAEAVAYIAADSSISEVLLSGGDPLTLPDSQLAALAKELEQIPHLQRLRLHTRLPIVLPNRVDRSLITWLTGSRLQPVVVVHANHPAEISPNVVAACRRLRDAGVTVLNQSVLLAGINDNSQTLTQLSQRLFAAGVLPYYLHVLDHVAGAAHFLIDDVRACKIHAEMAAQLPGYLVPRLVREEPGQAGKTWLR
jgi:L-lysine 2,3-aminomutase